MGSGDDSEDGQAKKTKIKTKEENKSKPKKKEIWTKIFYFFRCVKDISFNGKSNIKWIWCGE